ncbi:MAG: lysophospholipid acyltransferase family protein [Desulfonatronovibrio sp.]
MRFLFKLLASIYLVVIFAMISIFTLVFFRDKQKRLERVSRNTALFSPILLRIMGISFKVYDYTGGKGLTGRSLVVANHVSYLDVFVLAAMRPMLFISSVELSRQLFVGHISRLGGTVFVERRKNRNLREEINNISSALDHGFTLVLFPEATTSDGSGLLPFKPSLFEAAIKSGAEVVPVCIRYLKIDGQPISTVNKDRVIFHGGVRLIPHIIRLFRHHRVEVEVSVFDRISTAKKNRKELVRQAHQIISSCYRSGWTADKPVNPDFL